MNAVDYIILTIIAVSAILSFFNGFVRELVGVATWVLAFIAATYFYNIPEPFLQSYIETFTARVLASKAITFVAVIALGALVSWLMGKFIHITKMNIADAFVGLIWGGVRGAIIVTVIVAVLKNIFVAQDPLWQHSTLIPHFVTYSVYVDKAFDMVKGQFDDITKGDTGNSTTNQ